jgi:hypothetical protein
MGKKQDPISKITGGKKKEKGGNLGQAVEHLLSKN